MALAIYLTHPEVTIDPGKPVPDWSLSALGRSRTEELAAKDWMSRIDRIVSSREQKAIETAGILASRRNVVFEIRNDLHENDRSATGFLPPQEFEAMADRFFAEPAASICGWERAVDAQTRIVGAVRRILDEAPDAGLTLFVGHGGVGSLLLCHCEKVPIARQPDQRAGGGNWFAFDPASFRLVQRWQPAENEPSMVFS